MLLLGVTRGLPLTPQLSLLITAARVASDLPAQVRQVAEEAGKGDFSRPRSPFPRLRGGLADVELCCPRRYRREHREVLLGAREDLPPHCYPGVGARTAGDVSVMGCPLVPSSCLHLPPSPPAAWSHRGRVPAGMVAGLRWWPGLGQGWQEAAGGQAALTLLLGHRVRTSWGDVIFGGAGALGARSRLVDICFNKNHAGVCKPF